MAKQDITVCIDAYPDPDTDVFRIGAADDILRLLVDAHDTGSRSLNSSTPRVLLGRRSGGPSISSTVSTPSRFEKRLNATTSRSTQTVSRRTTRSLASLNQNSTRRSEHSSTASKPRPPTPTTSTTSLGSSSLEASLGGGRPTERYRLLRGRRWQPDDSPPADNRRRRRSPVRAVRR